MLSFQKGFLGFSLFQVRYDNSGCRVTWDKRWTTCSPPTRGSGSWRPPTCGRFVMNLILFLSRICFHTASRPTSTKHTRYNFRRNYFLVFSQNVKFWVFCYLGYCLKYYFILKNLAFILRLFCSYVKILLLIAPIVNLNISQISVVFRLMCF